MVMIFHKLMYLLGGIFFLFWVISAMRAAPHAERREPFVSRLFYLILLGIAIGLIVFDPLIYGPLLWRIFPESPVGSLIGLAILISGLGFAVWARLHLGQYWSARIVHSEGQALIQSGPYHLVRNPIYIGGLVGMIGTTILIGEVRAVLAVLIVLLAFLQKIKIEETFLREHFGSSYLEYQKKVKSLIPFAF